MSKQLWATSTYDMLGVAYECGRMARTALDVYALSYDWKMKAVRIAHNNRYIERNGNGPTKNFMLQDIGLMDLRVMNGARFGPDPGNEKLYKYGSRLKRQMTMSDIVTMLKEAGFSTHPDDKPDLESELAKHIDAYKSDTLEIPGWAQLRASMLDAKPYVYPDEVDQRVYIRRSTPINCFYNASEAKRAIIGMQAADSQDPEMEKRSLSDMPIRYSRIHGTLFTPSCVYRVFHIGEKALKCNETGEANFSAMFSPIANMIVPGRCPTDERSDVRPLLAFGDAGFNGAKRLLDIDHIDLNNKPFWMAKKEKSKMDMFMNTNNFGAPVMYIPVRREAVKMLSLMRFPLWNVLCDDMLLSDDGRLAPDVRTPFDADYSDGGKVLFCYDLNLTKISKAWRALGTVETKRLYIHCARWQKQYINELFEERCQSLGVEMFYPEYTDFFETCEALLRTRWEVEPDELV